MPHAQPQHEQKLKKPCFIQESDKITTYYWAAFLAGRPLGFFPTAADAAFLAAGFLAAGFFAAFFCVAAFLGFFTTVFLAAVFFLAADFFTGAPFTLILLFLSSLAFIKAPDSSTFLMASLIRATAFFSSPTFL